MRVADLMPVVGKNGRSQVIALTRLLEPCLQNASDVVEDHILIKMGW